MQSKSILHRCKDFEFVYVLSYRIVRRCVRCGQVYSLIRNNKGHREWVRGDFWSKTDSQISLFVLTGSPQEYIDFLAEAKELIKDHIVFPIWDWNEARKKIIIDNPNVPILLIGDWFENDAIQDPIFRREMNKRMLGD